MCRSTTRRYRGTCKLSAADKREIRRVSDQIGIQLWLRETERLVSREMVRAHGWPDGAVRLSLVGSLATAQNTRGVGSVLGT